MSDIKPKPTHDDQVLFAKICELLLPFSDEDRARVIKAVAILLDINLES